MSRTASVRVIDAVDSSSPTTPETLRSDTPETKTPAAAPAIGTPAPRRRRLTKRSVLFSLLPLALVAGGYFYVIGGQVMSTDNAYVGADLVGVSTDVSGIVEAIDVHEGDTVKKGQVLFRLRSASFDIALAGARAKLAAAVIQLEALKASYAQSEAEIEQAEADIPYFTSEFQRQQNLIAGEAASKAAFDKAKHDLDVAMQKVTVSKAQAATTLAQYGTDLSTPVEQNPAYLQAQAAVDDAQRQLDDAVVRAPYDGTVTNVSSLQTGQYLQAAQSGMSLVSTEGAWVAASPKETELTYVKPGQKATISVDAYPGVTWTGTVESISPASGSSFSLLPAQNTTGNWVKVVQRIPMRVTVDDTKGKPPLRVGMSTVVDIDTGHARGFPHFLKGLFGGRTGQTHE